MTQRAKLDMVRDGDHKSNQNILLYPLLEEEGQFIHEHSIKEVSYGIQDNLLMIIQYNESKSFVSNSYPNKGNISSAKTKCLKTTMLKSLIRVPFIF